MLSVDSHLLWGGFLALLACCLAIDLRAHRRPRELGLGDALRWTAVWVGLAVLCAAAVWLLEGSELFMQFLAAYSVEWSLSVDNVLVFAALIAGLAVPARHRYAVLFFGSLGAIVLRLAFLLAGSALLGQFGWLTYFFGAFLLVAAVRILREPSAGGQQKAAEPPATPRLLSRLPVPPLVLTALAVAVTDLMFATDSVPAVLGMTRDPFIAFASNAMAVVGLRSVYYLLEAAVLRFRYLKPALVTLLAFVGIKMLVDPLVPGDVPPAMSLGAILGILGVAALASWLLPRRRASLEPTGSIASNF
ncbi:MAG: tellurium resistance protein TerC [Chloroflexi bacterium]|nr:MAG: tellurium resistance protein TerC [Chloroflexota bacterium]